MFQVIFNMDHRASIEKIETILPSNWNVDETGLSCKVLKLMSDHEGVEVGRIHILTDETPGKILICVDEETSQGKQFWTDFGALYKELDPFDLRFGVIFLSDEDVAELDELSKEQSADPEILQHYSMVKNAFLVSFPLGHWHCGESLQVQTIARINEDGTIVDAPDMPKQFALASHN